MSSTTPRSDTLKKKITAAILALVLIGANFVYQAITGESFLDGKPTAGISAEDTSVHFIDVGQGDSELILSGSEAVLIDAGPTDAAQTVIDYLESQGVTRLRAVIATHPHEDHIGGMAKVLKTFDVDCIYVSNGKTTTRTYGNLLDAIESKQIETIVPTPGDVLTLSSGVTFTFLSPAPEEKFKELNNYSLVTRMTAGTHHVLFTGDAEKEIEASLLQSDFDLSCDVLKVGHHGSHSSSTLPFLQQLGASTAVISCAKDNSYGHPHKETLQNLQAAGITDIRRTDELGTIVLTFPTSTAA